MLAIMREVWGLVNKNINRTELFTALNNVYHGRTAYSLNNIEIVELIRKFQSRRKTDIDITMNITKREQTILLMLSEGLTSYEMADKLRLSKRTIDAHRSNLISKLNLRSLPEFN